MLRVLAQFASVVAGAVVWEIAGRSMNDPSLPPFSTVIATGWTLLSTGRFNVFGDSLAHLALGVGVAVIGGVLTACLIVLSRRGEAIVLPYINAAMGLPVVAFVPIFIVLFGFRDGPRIATIIAYSYFVVVINTYAGARSVDPELLEMARSMNAGPLRTFFAIRLPAAMPIVLEGIGTGVSRGLIGMVTGEYLVATAGVGGLLLNLSRNYRLPETYATVVIVLAIAMAVYVFFQALQMRLFFWTGRG